MAKSRELSADFASLVFDDLSTRIGTLQVRTRTRNTRENAANQPRQPFSPRYPNSLRVSSNPETEITGMLLTANNKLWVKYRPPGSHLDFLKLFGNDGTELGLWRGMVILEGSSLTCIEDTLLNLQNWHWLKPSGESGCLQNTPNRFALCSKSISPPYLLLSSGSRYKLHRLDVVSLDPLDVSLVAVCETSFTLEITPLWFDVSSCGTMFCVDSGSKVTVYSTKNPLNSTTVRKLVTGDKSNVDLQNFLPAGKTLLWWACDLTFRDACFFSKNGRDTLITSIGCSYYDDWAQHTATVLDGVFELDQDDGFLVKGNMFVAKLCTKLTAHSPSGKIWLGCKGGHIMVLGNVSQ